MGFFGLSVSLKDRKMQRLSGAARNVLLPLDQHATWAGGQLLPLLLSLHLKGVLQPVQQLVGELTHILL